MIKKEKSEKKGENKEDSRYYIRDVDKFSSSLANNLKVGGKFAIAHSLSREQLSHVHNKCDHKTTRALSSPEKESERFQKQFDILLAEEDNSSYLIVGKKR